MTCDMWTMTHDRWGEVNFLSNFELPSTNGLGVKVFWRYFHKGSLSQYINKRHVFVEPARLHGTVKYHRCFQKRLNKGIADWRVISYFYFWYY